MTPIYAKKQAPPFGVSACQHRTMTPTQPLSLSMLGPEQWLATRGSEQVGRIELRDDRYVVNAADSYMVGRYREFSKALAALDGYRGLHHSWKALLPVALLFGAGASFVAIYGLDTLF